MTYVNLHLPKSFVAERETAKAVLVGLAHTTTHDRKVWIPRRLISFRPPNDESIYAPTMHVPAWFAIKNGIV